MPRAVGCPSEAAFQVFIDRNEIQAIEQWREHEGNDELPRNETQHHLKVAEAAVFHHAGHGDVGDARYAGADHGKRYNVPRRTAVPSEKARIVGFASRQVGDGEKDDKVGGEGKQNG